MVDLHFLHLGLTLLRQSGLFPILPTQNTPVPHYVHSFLRSISLPIHPSSWIISFHNVVCSLSVHSHPQFLLRFLCLCCFPSCLVHPVTKSPRASEYNPRRRGSLATTNNRSTGKKHATCLGAELYLEL